MMYKITVYLNYGTFTFDCKEYEYVLEAAHRNSVDLPFSCWAGACSICVCKIISGTLDQSEGFFLDPDDIANNFALSCVARPKSDLILDFRNAEDDLLNKNY